jgi:hypothetical protein
VSCADFSRSGGGSWTSHQTGCGTLATNSMTKAGAKDMPDELKGCIDGCRSQLWRHSIASIQPAPRDCGQIRPPHLIIACQKCEVCFAMAPDFATCATMGLPDLPFLRHAAQFVVACSPPDPGGSIGRRPRLALIGTRSHDPPHHRNESLLICLAQIGEGLKVSGARRAFHSPEQRRARLG